MKEKIPEKENIIPLSFLTLGLKYIKLVSNIFEENKKQNNIHMIITSDFVTENSYNKITKWSDFNIIEPILFNFYHGLELIMKGLLLLDNSTYYVKPEHSLKELLNNIKLKKELPNSIKVILEKQILKDKINPILLKFMDDNRLNVDQLYKALRYPTEKNFINCKNYFNLHYKEENSLDYFSQIINDINQLSKEVVKFYREKEKD